MKENLTKEDIAEIINGRQYRDEIPEELKDHKDFKKFMICYFASDDLFETDGFNREEIGMYGGGDAHFNHGGLFLDFDELLAEEVIINSDWFLKVSVQDADNVDGGFYKFTSDVNNVPFFIMEDGEKYCRGLVFDASILKTSGEITISREEYCRLKGDLI